MRSKEEETINAYTHFLWGVLSLTFLLFFLIDSNISLKFKASSLLMVGLSSWTFFSSYLYHSSVGKKKNYNREIDKTSIYLMITGSGVSINLGTVDSTTAAISSIFLIVLGASLTAIYALKKNTSEAFSLTSYILLGWFCIFPITGLIGKNAYQESMPFGLILLGGLLYTIGIFYYARDSIKWNHTKWHIFVMGGYAAHLLAHYKVVSNTALIAGV